MIVVVVVVGADIHVDSGSMKFIFGGLQIGEGNQKRDGRKCAVGDLWVVAV